MKQKKTVANIFSVKDWSRDGKIDIDFFDFLGFFSINIRIEVHFCSFALENERTLVACKSLRIASRFTKFTRDQCLSFPNANEKVYFNP